MLRIYIHTYNIRRPVGVWDSKFDSVRCEKRSEVREEWAAERREGGVKLSEREAKSEAIAQRSD